MKNLKSVLLIASVSLLGLTQFSNSADKGNSAPYLGPVEYNDSTIQVLLKKIEVLESNVNSLSTEVSNIQGRRGLGSIKGDISDLESQGQQFSSRIDDLEEKNGDVESKLQEIKGTYLSTTSLNSLESEIRGLKRSSHDH